MTIEVIRGGKNSNGGDPVVGQGRICVEYATFEIMHSEPRGFGDSVYRLLIHPDSFAAVAQAMMHANSDAAIKAFGEAMQGGIQEPKKVWYPGGDISVVQEKQGASAA